MDRTALAQLLCRIAEDLDGKGYPYAACVRAGAVALLEAPAEPGARCCRVCGGPLTQAPRGRPRIFCSDTCRSRNRTKWNSRSNEGVSR
jgi:hypothetical protein